jgi:hypothetical protein
MALTLDTTSIPGKTIITDSITGGIAVISNVADDSTSPEYTIVNEIADKLTIIATHLESISNSLNNGSTPVGTILSDLAQASENSARALENSSASLAGILDRAQGDGIHMKGPQDWIGLISTYKLYVENEGPDKMTLAEFAEYFSKVDSLPKSF